MSTVHHKEYLIPGFPTKICNTHNHDIDIFRKPTITDTTVSFLSNHPMEHKIAIYRHYITRIHSLPLTPKQKQPDWTLIRLITQNNNFPQKLVHDLNLQIKHKKTNQDQTNGKNKNKKK
jgi:hypothetical protein